MLTKLGEEKVLLGGSAGGISAWGITHKGHGNTQGGRGALVPMTETT